MGMDADLIGIGQLNPGILKTGGLDYDGKHYRDVKPGTVLINTFFSCESTHASQELAEALGIDDPFDFGKHLVDCNREVDQAQLFRLLCNYLPEEQAQAHLDCFLECRKANWVFFFRPNF